MPDDVCTVTNWKVLDVLCVVTSIEVFWLIVTGGKYPDSVHYFRRSSLYHRFLNLPPSVALRDAGFSLTLPEYLFHDGRYITERRNPSDTHI